MGTILESVNNLSEKLGVEEREQTIKDQLDLCVERLGGEGYSVDIAESANKFADKEDGTATFTTKAITENGTYAASDDGVSGYSSVSVDVSGGLDTPTIFWTRATEKTDQSTPCTFVNSSNKVSLFFTDINGVAEISDRYQNPAHTFSATLRNSIIIGDVEKIDATINFYTTVTFKAATDFEGIYINDTKITETGDEIVSGNWYTVILEKDGTTLTATVSGDSEYTKAIIME